MAFKSVRRVFAHTQKIFSPPEEIFPLFCPVRGYEWIEDWNAELIFSHSGFAEKGCVFKTFDDEEGDDLWIIAEHIPHSKIKFIRTNQFRTMVYTISICPGPDNTSNLLLEQEMTSINERGSEYIADLEKEDFVNMVEMLEDFLNDYLHYFHLRLKKAGQ